MVEVFAFCLKSVNINANGLAKYKEQIRALRMRFTEWKLLYFYSNFAEVSEWIDLTAFLGTADSEVHIVHINRVIIAYTLESLSSLT